MYTQSLFVLTERYLNPDEVAGQLRRIRLGNRIVPPSSEHWSRMTEGWSLRPQYCDDARLAIDSVAHTWPSDRLFNEHRAIFIAQKMGLFGPYVDGESWSRARHGMDASFLDKVDTHEGFVRLRMSYRPHLDEERLSQRQLHLQALAYMIRAAYFILEHDMALALFMPAADRLMGPRDVWRAYDGAFGEMQNLWTIWTRLYAQKSAIDGHSSIRVRGLRQVGAHDFDIDGGHLVPGVLRNAAEALIKRAIESGHPGPDSEILTRYGLRDNTSHSDTSSTRVLALSCVAS
jgi:hypothetical protein